MLHIQINPHTGVPVYRQVMDQITRYVAAGILRPEDRLPSIRELARKLRVNPTTVVKAYTELQHEGLIQMQQGKGAFITDKHEHLDAAQRVEALRPLARQLAVEATQLQAPDEQVMDLVQEEIKALRGAPGRRT